MRKLLALVFTFVAALAWAPGADAYRGSITVVLPDDAPTMDPNVSSSGIGLTIWRWSYDTLVSADARTGKNIPWLAERWEKLGPTQYKFWLRKGVKFSDGTPLTTAAIQYTIDRIRDPELKSVQRGFFEDLDRFEFLDDHTFVWHLKRPDNGLLHRLERYFLVISPKAKEAPKTAPARETFGSGPYVLSSWTKGLKMVFEANPTWWGNSLHPDRPKTVVMRPIRESTTRVK
ncbi:MAG: ABC transporter substrate-binding protein, partial [Nitrospinota bacterium]